MIIRRGSRPKSAFYILDHAIAEDSRLSWEARGILVFLLVKPDDWQVSVTHLVKQGHAGRDKIYSILKELMGAGYASREQPRAGGKFGDTAYVIHEVPLPEIQDAVRPLTDLPETVSPDTAKPTQVNIQRNQESTEQEHGPQSRPAGVTREAFEELLSSIRSTYPNRDGSQRWADAIKALRARISEGHSFDELINGVGRYAAYCEAKRIDGSDRVQQAATFFGANKGFLDSWVPKNPGNSMSYPAHDDEAGWIRLAKELDVPTRQGESWNSFRARIRDARSNSKPAVPVPLIK